MNTVSNISISTRKTTILTGLILALLLPAGLITFASLGWLNKITFEIGYWAIAFTLIAYALLIEQKSFSSLGFRKLSFKGLLWGIGLGLLLLIVFPVASVLIKLVGLEVSQENAKALAGMPVYSLFLLALRAAVTEEILYRSYPIERLIAVTGSKAVAAAVPLLVFIVSHLSWGLGHLLFVTLAGGILTAFYLWKRNIWINIIGHFFVDFVVFMLLPLFIAKS
ncbi:CPBP family intramembrane glutamic endopeptidase [Pontibacter locisalis]|uniref:CPBP family intramembrane glutamic endopeptidase n=1 Tax=Pontibacter locisalis TaxID=1719035 RepID=A0ABW5IL26_9BACT